MLETECPCCLATGQEILHGRTAKKCHICKGKGIVPAELAEDFINSLKLEILDDEFINNQ